MFYSSHKGIYPFCDYGLRSALHPPFNSENLWTTILQTSGIETSTNSGLAMCLLCLHVCSVHIHFIVTDRKMVMSINNR